MLTIEGDETNVGASQTVDFQMILHAREWRRPTPHVAAIVFAEENVAPVFRAVLRFQITHQLYFNEPSTFLYVPNESEFVSKDLPFRYSSPNSLDRLMISASEKLQDRLATIEIIPTEADEGVVRVKVRRADLGKEVIQSELKLVDKVTKSEAKALITLSREQDLEVLPSVTEFVVDNETSVANHLIYAPELANMKGPVTVDCNAGNNTVSADITRVGSKLVRVQLRVKKSLIETLSVHSSIGAFAREIVHGIRERVSMRTLRRFRLVIAIFAPFGSAPKRLSKESFCCRGKVSSRTRDGTCDGGKPARSTSPKSGFALQPRTSVQGSMRMAIFMNRKITSVL